MKKWLWYVLGALFFLAAGGGVLYGVLTHKEPGLMTVCWIDNQAHYDGTCAELRWELPQFPLTYFIDFDKDHQTYTDSVVKAAQMWNNEIGNVFKRADVKTDATVVVSWGAVPKKDHAGGYTTHQGQTGPVSANVVLTDASDVHAVYRYAAHEFGHVLGLAHDEFTKSIMYSIQPGMTGDMTFVLPSDYDKKLLRGLYR